MTKRILASLLALTMTFSTGALLAGAEEVEISENYQASVERSTTEETDENGVCYRKKADGTWSIVSAYIMTSDNELMVNGALILPTEYKGQKVTEIGGFFLEGANISFKTVVIPDSVTTIDACAFVRSFCESVNIPKNVKSIGFDAFFESGVKTITVDSQNQYFTAKDGILYNKSMTVLVACPSDTSVTNMTIPTGVKIIGEGAFHNISSLKSVVIPEGVTTIEGDVVIGSTAGGGFGAFSGCQNLTSATIPKSVTTFGKGAFGNCPKLTIKCYSGSAAEKYAKENGIKYELISESSKPGTAQISGFSSTTTAVRINWNKVSGASGYRVYRYNTTTKKWDTVKTISGGSTVTYRDSGLKAGTNYKYKVKAYVKKNGNTYWGDVSSTLTTATKPTAVKITKAGKTTTAIRLYWNKVNCTGYKLQQYNPSTKKWTTVKVLKSTDTNYRIGGLKKNTAYKFRIQAYKTAGTQKAYSAWSATKTVTTKK